jgi:hypothetical protein
MWPFKKRKYGTCEWDGKTKPKLWSRLMKTSSGGPYGPVYHRHDENDESTEFYCCKCNNKHLDKLNE